MQSIGRLGYAAVGLKTEDAIVEGEAVEVKTGVVLGSAQDTSTLNERIKYLDTLVSTKDKAIKGLEEQMTRLKGSSAASAELDRVKQDLAKMTTQWEKSRVEVETLRSSNSRLEGELRLLQSGAGGASGQGDQARTGAGASGGRSRVETTMTTATSQGPGGRTKTVRSGLVVEVEIAHTKSSQKLVEVMLLQEKPLTTTKLMKTETKLK
jgi:hypothetical protein